MSCHVLPRAVDARSCCAPSMATGRAPRLPPIRPSKASTMHNHATMRISPSARGSVHMQATDGGVMDAPSSSKKLDPKGSKQKSPIYNVLLHNDPFNKREYVVKVLIKVVDGFDMTDAMRVMMEAHENGIAVVVSVPQVDAEKYCENLRGNGLHASVRPS